MKKHLLVIAVAVSSLSAIGAEQKWESGWGQGTTEYVVKGQGKSQLYIGCDPYKAAFVMYTDPEGRSLSNYDGMEQTRQFYVSVDGGEAILFNDVESNSGANNFKFAWNKLRHGKSVKVTGDNIKPAIFTLSSAGKVLPEISKSDCKIGWDVPA